MHDQLKKENVNANAYRMSKLCNSKVSPAAIFTYVRLIQFVKIYLSEPNLFNFAKSKLSFGWTTF